MIVNVVNAMELAEAVGVVQPSGFRHQVVMKAAGVIFHVCTIRFIFLIPLFIIRFKNFFVFLQDGFLSGTYGDYLYSAMTMVSGPACAVGMILAVIPSAWGRIIMVWVL